MLAPKAQRTVAARLTPGAQYDVLCGSDQVPVEGIISLCHHLYVPLSSTRVVKDVRGVRRLRMILSKPNRKGKKR